MNKGSVLITGATGIMGSWVVGEALTRGYQPVVLMRDSSEEHARERLSAVLGLVGHSARLSDIRILLGDTRHPQMGLDDSVVEELRQSLDSMIHCAACTSFSTSFDEELWQTNVGGVENVLNFLSGSGVSLYYVSTAYVAGKRRGKVLETDLNFGQEFNNTYERSKCHAEGMVREAVGHGRVRASIFRPGIIVGASSQGGISQFLNFYSFLRFVDMMGARSRNAFESIRMPADPVATKNLVPVDWTARALWQIIETDGPAGHTYHLTNPKPVTHQSLLEWANKHLSPAMTRIQAVDKLNGNATGIEEVCRAAFAHYFPYMHGEPQFDRTNTDRALAGHVPFPEVGPELYTKLLEFARANRWRGIFGCKTRVKPSVQDNGKAALKHAMVS